MITYGANPCALGTHTEIQATLLTLFLHYHASYVTHMLKYSSTGYMLMIKQLGNNLWSFSSTANKNIKKKEKRKTFNLEIQVQKRDAGLLIGPHWDFV